MKDSKAPELSITGKVRNRRKEKSEIAGGILFFLVYWTVC